MLKQIKGYKAVCLSAEKNASVDSKNTSSLEYVCPWLYIDSLVGKDAGYLQPSCKQVRLDVLPPLRNGARCRTWSTVLKIQGVNERSQRILKLW